MKHPIGKGMFIFIVRNLFGGNVAQIAQRARELRLDWVVVKGAHKEELQNQETLPDLISALRTAGINVWLYHRMHGDAHAPSGDSATRKAETRAALGCIERFAPTGWLLDAEAEYKDQPNAARLHMQELRTAFPDLPIGLCSFRFPNFHRQLPWQEFLAQCDFHAPQVYWAGSIQSFGSPTNQLRRSIDELTALRALPVVPVGQAYREHGFQPTRQELDEFDQAVKELGLPGLCWFRWGHVEELDLGSTIAAHEWQPRLHEVQAGETLTGLAERYHLPLASLIEANPALLQPGQQLRIPSATQSMVADGATYTVQPGDTLSKIASRFHIDMNLLAAINNILNPNIIHVGQVLKLSV